MLFGNLNFNTILSNCKVVFNKCMHKCNNVLVRRARFRSVIISLLILSVFPSSVCLCFIVSACFPGWFVFFVCEFYGPYCLIQIINETNNNL